MVEFAFLWFGGDLWFFFCYSYHLVLLYLYVYLLLQHKLQGFHLRLKIILTTRISLINFLIEFEFYLFWVTLFTLEFGYFPYFLGVIFEPYL